MFCAVSFKRKTSGAVVLTDTWESGPEYCKTASLGFESSRRSMWKRDLLMIHKPILTVNSPDEASKLRLGRSEKFSPPLALTDERTLC